jgi:hypothetical protein
MDAVYRNSTLTIAESRGASVRSGFLEVPTSLPQFEVPLLLTDGRLQSASLRDFDEYDFYYDPKLFKQGEPLEQRAWALQESILPTRLIS